MLHCRSNVAALLLAALSFPAFAQFDGNAAARAAFQQGEKAWNSANYAEASADYQKAIALDPNFVDAYQEYIFVDSFLANPQPAGAAAKQPDPDEEKKERAAVDARTQTLVLHFQTLSQQHPDRAIYLWALAQIYDESNPSRQEDYCRQAVHVDPSFAPGYHCLAQIANLRGDDEQASALDRKSMELQRNSADAALQYAWRLRNDSEAYRDFTLQMIRKFPDAPQSAQALDWLADHQENDAARIQYFEQLQKQFPPDNFAWSEDGAEALFAIYDRTDSSKARALAHAMVRALPKDEDWKTRAAYADGMAKAEKQLAANHPSTALATLEATKPPGGLVNKNRKDLLNARALELEGKSSDAYSSLLSAEAHHPTDEMRAALTSYGAKLGKTTAAVEADLWSAIQTASTPAIPFSLPDFDTGKQVSLASYQGHVVIVDFWFPNCGPCRQSFPYLQKIAHKYKESGLVVLAINNQQGQEAFVLPLLRSKGYEFIPLKGNEDWDGNVYHVRSFPSTFLIGPDGRQYFRPHIYNDFEERTAELEVEELLAHGGHGS